MSSLPATKHSSEFNSASFDWAAVDTVLLDMDGTLLDLRFDNYFWLELIPQAYAKSKGIEIGHAQAELAPRFAAYQGLLEWYCTDHWSRELNLNIPALKETARQQIDWLPGAKQFLERLRRTGKRRLLITNAHHDTLAIKHAKTQIGDHFDSLVSSHRYGYAKEHAEFWNALHREHAIDPSRTVFVDDSLPVLRAARAYGIAHIFAITHPDSTQSVRECTEFNGISRVAQLLPQNAN
jgi:HAD superfamily hydrolase (TIGR01509 family)